MPIFGCCRPMDMMSIKKNIENGSIRTTAEFQRDMMLMFTNAIMYNSSNHDVYSMAKEMYDDVMVHIEVRPFSESGYILLPCNSGPGSCLSCSLSVGLGTVFPFTVFCAPFCFLQPFNVTDLETSPLPVNSSTSAHSWWCRFQTQNFSWVPVLCWCLFCKQEYVSNHWWSGLQMMVLIVCTFCYVNSNALAPNWWSRLQK